MRYAAAITLYNPDISQIMHCKEYADSFELVYVIDNSEIEDRSIAKEFDGDSFKYIKMNGNVGLPSAFNCVLETKDIDKYDYLCTLDQDSIYSHANIARMKSFIEACSKGTISINYSKVAVFAPIIDYGVGIKTDSKFEERKWAITSGSFICMEKIKKDKIRYDDNYFIDKFEIDLCQQLRLRGYMIIVYKGSILVQNLGDGNKGKHSSHSALRHYYLFRNRLYFNHKYYCLPKRIALNILQTGRHCYRILAYENDKVKKISQLSQAIKDFECGCMGKRIYKD